VNRQFFYLLLAAAAVWFFNRKSAAAARDRPGKPPANQPAEEEAERTRRVREEVRRKIAERRAESGRPPLFAPVPAARPPAPTRIPPPPPLRPAPAPTEMGDDLTVLAAQRKLEEQMQALEAAEAAGKRSRQLSSLGQPLGALPGLQQGGAGLRASMAAPAGVVDIRELRRAIVWREILGKPIGLR
jgi:hypothetical protein